MTINVCSTVGLVEIPKDDIQVIEKYYTLDGIEIKAPLERRIFYIKRVVLINGKVSLQKL